MVPSPMEGIIMKLKKFAILLLALLTLMVLTSGALAGTRIDTIG